MLSVKFEISSSSDLKWVCITSMVKNTEETPIASIKFKNTAEKEKKSIRYKNLRTFYCLKYFIGKPGHRKFVNPKINFIYVQRYDVLVDVVGMLSDTSVK